MTSKPWQPYAMHILDAIERIRHVQQRGDVREDQVLYDAALRNLQTLSEATQKLPDAQKARSPHIPQESVGLANRRLQIDRSGPFSTVFLSNSQAIGLQIRQKLASLGPILAIDDPNPTDSWREISGFRNILVHNYLGDIDPVAVADVIEQHLAPLKTAVEDMLQASRE